MSLNFERDMAIDTTSLDVEWTLQAELAMKYGKLYAESKDKVLRAEEAIKLIRAELLVKAGNDPMGCCKKEKPTVADFESYYRVHVDHISAKNKWMDAVEELGVLEIAKNEIAFTRKSALENLVVLHGQQYFAGPKMPRDLETEVSRYKEKKAAREKSNQQIKPLRRRES